MGSTRRYVFSSLFTKYLGGIVQNHIARGEGGGWNAKMVTRRKSDHCSAHHWAQLTHRLPPSHAPTFRARQRAPPARAPVWGSVRPGSDGIVCVAMRLLLGAVASTRGEQIDFSFPLPLGGEGGGLSATAPRPRGCQRLPGHGPNCYDGVKTP